MELTIPAFVPGLSEQVERLMFRFGSCRRRAYSMKQRGIDRLEIIRRLREETSLHTRYVWTAYEMIKDLPPHVTFGGKRLQRLRERGKISKDEYRRCRNSILACIGQAWSKGNLCLRVIGNQLRMSVAPREWVYLPLKIPERYERYKNYLDGSKPYTVLLKRRLDDRGYDVRITINVDEPEICEPRRVMALDINSGHVDFAVVGKGDLRPVAFGRINCHELLNGGRGKNRLILHSVVNKIKNVAKHYGAEVVAGKLRTIAANLRRANRMIHRMSQHMLRQIMRYKLPLNGIKFSERSEASTSKVGSTLSKAMGIDVHKASAYAFAIKVIDHQAFAFLRGVRADEGDGSLSAGLSGGSGLTALRQSVGLAHDEGTNVLEATPRFMGRGGGLLLRPFQATILRVSV